MLDRLKKIIGISDPTPAQQTEDDLPLAVAALLVEAARIDETYDTGEIHLIDEALGAQFQLGASEAAALRCRAEEEQSAALDIHRFTKVVKRMAEEDKIRLIETLWRIVLADNEKDSFEDALIRRICGLIYVDDQDSGAARKRIERELASGG